MLVPAVRAQEETDVKQAEPPSPDQQYEKLVAEHQTAYNAFMAKYREAKTNEERSELMPTYYALPKDFAPKFLELAEANADDEVALQACMWIVQRASTTPEAKTAAKLLLDSLGKDASSPQILSAVMTIATRTSGETAKMAQEKLVEIAESKPDDPAMIMPLASVMSARSVSEDIAKRASAVLIENFADKDEFAQVCFRLSNQDLLREVIEKTSNRSVKGHAMLALGRTLVGRPVTANDEGEKLLEKVVDQFGDVESFRGTLGEMAAGPLFELRNLQIGMVAPNIEGEDVDGESFQLEDYRGKVVVLDFWGDW
jgi:hypothetical protein